MWFDAFPTRIGTMTVAMDDAGLRHVLFPENRHGVADRADWKHDAVALAPVREQFLEYFDGHRTHFDLPLAPEGTPFQLKVWKTLASIPYGETWSYRDLAIRIEAPKAVRAVGAANGRNPLPIVLPCHRVIGADGRLIGFGGGLPLKQFLLDHEGAGRKLI